MTAAELYERSKYFFPPPPPPRPWNYDTYGDAPSRSGVYFLYRGACCVYVGESIDIRHRLIHHNHLASCDGVGFIECDKSQRRRLECFYIGLLDPILNSESTVNTSLKDKKRRTSAVRRKSQVLQFLEFVRANPGCSASSIYRENRSLNASSRREIIEFLERWGAVTCEVVATAGRPRTSVSLKTGSMA